MPMTNTEKNLRAFARRVLSILQDDPEWSSDTLAEIATAAHDLGLAEGAPEFSVKPGVLDEGAPA